MPNPYFTISPASGHSTQGDCVVSATSTNDTGAIRRARVFVATAYGDAGFEVQQLFRPILTQGPTSIPATGGSITITIKSDYDYVFRSVPTWITIYDSSNNVVQEGQKIYYSPDNDYTKTYTLTAPANPGSSRSVGATFNMAIYSRSGQALTRYPYYISVTQQGEVPDKNITLSPILINVASGDTTATVNIIETNTTLDNFYASSAGTFTITATKSGNTMVLSFPQNNTPQERRGYLSFYLYDNDGGAWTSTITVVQAAGDTPYISVSPSSLAFDYNSAQSKTFTISTNCQVTVTNGNQSMFSISQNGNTVTVTTQNYNYGTTNNTGTITISDNAGVAQSASVSLTQYYRPRLNQQASYPIPASGGTINFTIDPSAYTTRLKDIPAFVTITDTQGNTYTDGLEMTAAWCQGRTFIINFSANTGTTARDEGTFHLETVLNGSWSSVGSFNFEQEPASGGGYILISPQNAYLDYPMNRWQYYHVSSPGVGDMSAAIDDTTNFAVDPVLVSSDTVSVNSETLNNTRAYRYVTLTLTDTQDSSITGSTTLTQRYQPYFDTMSGNFFPATGGVITFVVHTEYDIDFYNIPAWITITDFQGNTITNGQRITAANAHNKTFTLTASANAASSVREVHNTFQMRNYMNNTVLEYIQYFAFSQGGSATEEQVAFSIDFVDTPSGDTINVTISLASDTYAYETLTYREDGTYDETTTGEFDCIAAEGDDITIALKINSATNPNVGRVVYVDYNDGAEGNVDTIYPGETVALVTQYIPGATITFKVEG